VSGAASHSRDESVAWGITAGGTPRWPALTAVLVATALQLVLLMALQTLASPVAGAVVVSRAVNILR
jgi:hypothetical protein